MKKACAVEIDCLGVVRSAEYRPQKFAKSLNFGLRQVERGFNECKTTLREWVDEVQLWDAAHMLEEGEQPKNLSASLGFKSESHFFHKFKDYHGCTPGEYLEGCVEGRTERRKRWKMNLKPGQSLSGLTGFLTPEEALEFLRTIPIRSRTLRKHILRYACREKAVNVGIPQ